MLLVQTAPTSNFVAYPRIDRFKVAADIEAISLDELATELYKL